MLSDGFSRTTGTPSLMDFTNTFVLSSSRNSEHQQVLCEVPKALVDDPFRQRRAHQKSKTGCENCRKRRVKCNEETPCSSCTRRGERCEHLGPSNRVTSILSMPTQTLPSSSVSTNNVVNLLHMKLFHHFQSYTQKTLFFPPDVWDHVLQLSFQFEFLMNAILCVAARHLAILQPEDMTYPTAAASHLCRALSRFRHELSSSLISTLDAFIATSVLLQYEVWTSTDFFSASDKSIVSFDPSRDYIFTFNSSLKQVFLKSVPFALNQPTVVLPYIAYDPMEKLIGAAQISNHTLAKYQGLFSYRRPLSLELLDTPLPYTRGMDLAISNPWLDRVPEIQDTPNLIENGYTPVITRLCLIMSFLPEARPLDSVDVESPLLPELARYIFTFPVLCYGPFASMVQQRDPHALLLLYHFYRAVRILLPLSECWWAHERATVSEGALKEWLTRECAKQADNALD